MKMNCCWDWVERLCAPGARGLTPLALFLVLPAAMWPQGMPQDVAQDLAGARELPSGFRVNSVSGWVGRNYLLVQNAAGTPAESYLLGYGGGFDAGFYLPGKTNRASIDYSLGYNGNTTYSQLSGLDHVLSLSWTKTLTRSFSLSVTGTGESTTVQGFLFQQPVSTAPDLSNAGTLAGSLAATVAAGRTQTILYPGRRQTATAAVTLSYASSVRSSWHVSLNGQRLLPSNSNNSGAQQNIGYPGETNGGVNLAYSYSLSRRTSFGVELGYFRGISALARTQTLSSGFSLTRVLSRRWFSSATAGYGYGDYFVPATKTTVRRPDFTGRATLGATFDSHTLSLSAAELIGDSYGFGAQHTLDGELAWMWHPKRQKWAFQASAAYERLTGLQVDKLQSTMFRGVLTRRLTAKLSCAAEGTYMWGLGQATGANFGRQTQNGARFSLVWRPSGTLW
jgi:hypothetical protein